MPGKPNIVDGYLNLWLGFGVEARQGDWHLMRAHIREVLANGNDDLDDYITKFSAWKVQNPGERTEVALVFQGKKGCGKGVFGRALKRIFGQHGIQINSANQLTGKFNAHLRDCAFLFADEAFFPGDRSSVGTLNRIITEPTIFVEGKGRDGVEVRNHLAVMVASNEKWVITATLDERRLVMPTVNERYAAEFTNPVHTAERKAYFDALYAEMENGGLEAMLYDLQHLELGDWHPRQVIMTASLMEQVYRSLRGADAYYKALVFDGELPSRFDNERRCRSSDLFEHAKRSVPDVRHATKDEFCKDLGKISGAVSKNPGGKDGGRCWEFPPLRECREIWLKKYHAVEPVEWKADPSTDWVRTPEIAELRETKELKKAIVDAEDRRQARKQMKRSVKNLRKGKKNGAQDNVVQFK